MFFCCGVSGRRSFRRRTRPRADVTKVSITIRLDLDIIEAFKAEGSG
ncbi:BrnA antitoxin family protein [uncultured Sulfitobacter sp.]|nr:BrnA antitoxin family protein [uncultured Sulfitobacter sp.]